MEPFIRNSPNVSTEDARLFLEKRVRPRSFVGAWRYGRRAFAQLKIDPSASAGMLAALATRGRRIPYDELAVHALKQPEKAFADLLLLDIVQHLGTQPQGLVISSKCRETMTGIKSNGIDF